MCTSHSCHSFLIHLSVPFHCSPSNMIWQVITSLCIPWIIWELGSQADLLWDEVDLFAMRAEVDLLQCSLSLCTSKTLLNDGTFEQPRSRWVSTWQAGRMTSEAGRASPARQPPWRSLSPLQMAEPSRRLSLCSFLRNMDTHGTSDSREDLRTRVLAGG